MKEIKAYIRTNKAEEVIDALRDIGFTDVTLIDVMAIGSLADPHQSKYSISCVEKYSEVAKLEIVCPDDDAYQIVEVIRKKAYTGLPGDGMVVVSPVEMTLKIKTGAVDESESEKV